MVRKHEEHYDYPEIQKPLGSPFGCYLSWCVEGNLLRSIVESELALARASEALKGVVDEYEATIRQLRGERRIVRCITYMQPSFTGIATCLGIQ